MRIKITPEMAYWNLLYVLTLRAIQLKMEAGQ